MKKKKYEFQETEKELSFSFGDEDVVVHKEEYDEDYYSITKTENYDNIQELINKVEER